MAVILLCEGCELISSTTGTKARTKCALNGSKVTKQKNNGQYNPVYPTAEIISMQAAIFENSIIIFKFLNMAACIEISFAAGCTRLCN